MQLLKENIVTRSAKFFENNIVKLDAQAKSDIADGRKVLKTMDFYIRKKLSGGTGIIDLIETTDNLVDGITNIDKAKLAPGQHACLSAIGVSYARDSGSTLQPDAVLYTSNIWDIHDSQAATTLNTAVVPVQKIPTAIVNSVINFSVGDTAIANFRTKKFLSDALANHLGEANDENCVMLDVPKMLPAEKLLKFQLKYGPNAPALPAGFHFLEVRLQGVYLADR